jgi:hypothetical protein
MTPSGSRLWPVSRQLRAHFLGGNSMTNKPTPAAETQPETTTSRSAPSCSVYCHPQRSHLWVHRRDAGYIGDRANGAFASLLLANVLSVIAMLLRFRGASPLVPRSRITPRSARGGLEAGRRRCAAATGQEPARLRCTRVPCEVSGQRPACRRQRCGRTCCSVHATPTCRHRPAASALLCPVLMPGCPTRGRSSQTSTQPTLLRSQPNTSVPGDAIRVR